MFVYSASGWENASKYVFEYMNEQRAGSGWGLCPLGSLKSLSGTGRLLVCRAAHRSGGEVARPVAGGMCLRRDVEDGSFATVCVCDCVCSYRRVKDISTLNQC